MSMVIRDDNNNQSETLMAGKKRTESELATLKAGILEMYRTTSDSLTKIRKEFGVPSNTIYNWKKNDEEFAEALNFREHITDYQLDLAEDGLARLLKKDNWNAIKYVLDKKGVPRGWEDVKKIDTVITHRAIAKIEVDQTDEQWGKNLKKNQKSLPTCQEDVNAIFKDRLAPKADEVVIDA